MAQDHRLQQQRYELKYLLPEKIVSEMRDFVRCYLEPDEYALGRPDLAYPVHSVYLDTDGLKTYHDTINGTKNRFKLRLRYYDGRPETPVFFEIKGRVGACILKQRCGVKREAVNLIEAGQLPDASMILSKEPRHLVSLQRFVTLVHQLKARPKLHNTYTREAWVSAEDNSLRVTFDRRVTVEPFFRLGAPVEMKHGKEVYPKITILEVKFTTRFPNWLKDLVRSFDLMQSAAAKYVGGVTILGEFRFHDGYQTQDWRGRMPNQALGHEMAPDMLAYSAQSWLEDE
jgi:hypothetical protein